MGEVKCFLQMKTSERKKNTSILTDCCCDGGKVGTMIIIRVIIRTVRMT